VHRQPSGRDLDLDVGRPVVDRELDRPGPADGEVRRDALEPLLVPPCTDDDGVVAKAVLQFDRERGHRLTDARWLVPQPA